MAVILKGALVADAMSKETRERAEKLKEAGITPTLAIIRVGERPGDIFYENAVMQCCEKNGIVTRRFLLWGNYEREQLLSIVRQINQDEKIHGCLLFRHLPIRDDEMAACALLSPEKDVDGMTPASLMNVFTEQGGGFPPCAAQACMEILRYFRVELSGKRAAVIGRSLWNGKALSMMLQRENATVTMCHRKTADIAAACRNAELLITAAGHPGMIDERFVSPRQIVLDVGISLDERGNPWGDVRADRAAPIIGAVTPVPGGVGVVTTAVLARHVVEAAEKKMPEAGLHNTYA